MDRTKDIIKTGIIGIAANALLSATKIFIGFLSHSVAITVDGVNNLGDALSSVITIVGARLSTKEPDRKHPFGYGRIESVASLIIGMIIVYAGIGAIRESVLRIIRPVATDYSREAIAAICAALLVKIALGFYTKRKGEALDSEALVASGKDSINDSYMSAATIISALIFITKGINIEMYVGLIIAVLVLRTGVETVHDTVSDILGERVSAELIKKVRESIMSFPEVSGVYDIVLHSYGKGRMIGSAHIEIPDVLTAAWVDNLQRVVYRKVYEDTGIEMMGISVYAVNSDDSTAAGVKADVDRILEDFSEVIAMHGFYYDIADRAIKFDVVTGFEVTDRAGLASRIAKRVAKDYPEYDIEVVVDYEITD